MASFTGQFPIYFFVVWQWKRSTAGNFFPTAPRVLKQAGNRRSSFGYLTVCHWLLVITISSWQTILIVTAAYFSRAGRLLEKHFETPAARTLIGYFEVTWHLTIKIFSRQNLWAGNTAQSMTSESNSALLPVNVDRATLYDKSLKDWFLGKQLILFPSNLSVSQSRYSLETNCKL